MGKRKGLLARIDAARIGNWMESLGGPRPLDSLEEILDPGLKQVGRLTDEELAEVVAREPTSKMGLLAAQIMRHRESWRTPAKWALIVSILSLVVAAWALMRTL